MDPVSKEAATPTRLANCAGEAESADCWELQHWTGPVSHEDCLFESILVTELDLWTSEVLRCQGLARVVATRAKRTTDLANMVNVQDCKEWMRCSAKGDERG